MPEQEPPPKGPTRAYLKSVLESEELTAEEKVETLKDWIE
jgi:hypothetical protein